MGGKEMEVTQSQHYPRTKGTIRKNVLIQIKLVKQKGTPNRTQPIKHGSEIQRQPVVELTSRCRGAQLPSSNPGHFDRPKNHLK